MLGHIFTKNLKESNEGPQTDELKIEKLSKPLLFGSRDLSLIILILDYSKVCNLFLL